MGVSSCKILGIWCKFLKEQFKIASFLICKFLKYGETSDVLNGWSLWPLTKKCSAFFRSKKVFSLFVGFKIYNFCNYHA